MPRDVIYRCAVCNIEKKQTNHWYVFDKTKVGLHIHTFSWGLNEGDLDQLDYLCGEECAHKLLSQYFADQLARWATPAISS